MLNINLSWSVRVFRRRREFELDPFAAIAMRVRGHTAKADEALSLLSFHRHA